MILSDNIPVYTKKTKWCFQRVCDRQKEWRCGLELSRSGLSSLILSKHFNDPIGTRIDSKIGWKLQLLRTVRAFSDALSAFDPDLARLVAAWPTQTESDKGGYPGTRGDRQGADTCPGRWSSAVGTVFADRTRNDPGVRQTFFNSEPVPRARGDFFLGMAWGVRV